MANPTWTKVAEGEQRAFLMWYEKEYVQLEGAWVTICFPEQYHWYTFGTNDSVAFLKNEVTGYTQPHLNQPEQHYIRQDLWWEWRAACDTLVT